MHQIICRECGVELDEGMEVCPLCRHTVSGPRGEFIGSVQAQKPVRGNFTLKHLVWQVVCILLLSAIGSSILVNVSTKGHMTWSVYPVLICLILLSYAVPLGVWKSTAVRYILAGWSIAAAILFASRLILSADWPTTLVLPAVTAVSVVVIAVVFLASLMRKKSLNLLAIILVAAGLLSLLIDGIISRYVTGTISISWSIVVLACLLPIAGVVIFMHFRMKNNTELKKIFHT